MKNKSLLEFRDEINFQCLAYTMKLIIDYSSIEIDHSVFPKSINKNSKQICIMQNTKYTKTKKNHAFHFGERK